MKFLTNLIFEPQGKHDSSLPYNIKDTVMSADGSKVYFALQDVPAGVALSNTDYWMLQIDLSSTKSAMDDALASFGNYAKEIGTRVKGESAKATGNPATFLPDAGSLLQPVTVLEPKQAGSGDPYYAGAGKNLIPYPYVSGDVYESNGLKFVANSDGTVTVNGTATAETFFTLSSNIPLEAGTYFCNGAPSGDFGGSLRPQFWFRNSANTFKTGIYSEGKAINVSESDVFSISIDITKGNTLTNAVFKPMLVKGSAAVEYEPYSNIRPISGFDALELRHCGRNLLDYKTIRTYTTNTDYKIADDSLRVYTTAERAWAGLSYPYMTVKKDVTYRFSLDVVSYVSGLMTFCVRNESAQILKSVQGKSVGHYTFTYTPSEDRTVFPSIMVCNGDTVLTGDMTFSNIQMEIGDTFTDYTPYQSNAYTVQIGQTVYGGKMDWLTGKLVADRKLVTFTGTEAFSKLSDTTAQKKSSIFYIGALFKDDCAKIDFDGSVCSHFKNVREKVYTVGYDGAVGVYSDNASTSSVYYNKYFRWGTGDSTVAEFKAFIAEQYAAGTPVQLAYTLATPIEIQLTPQIISAADPEQTNTLYGDGSIEAEYVKPLHVSIGERVAAAVAAAMQQ